MLSPPGSVRASLMTCRSPSALTLKYRARPGATPKADQTTDTAPGPASTETWIRRVPAGRLWYASMRVTPGPSSERAGYLGGDLVPRLAECGALGGRPAAGIGQCGHRL